MDPLLLTILLLVITLIIIFMVINFCRGKNLPPTIFPTIPIIGHLYLVKPPLFRTLSKLTAEHGPILLLRFGFRNVLVVSSPSITEQCFTKDNDIIFANRPKLLFARILAYNSRNTAWANYGPYFINLRKIASTEFFSAMRVEDFKAVRANEGLIMVRNIVPDSALHVDLSSIVGDFFTNNVIMMVAGRRFSGEDEAVGKQLQEIVRETFEFGNGVNLGDYLPFLEWLGFTKELEARMWECVEKRDTFFSNMLEEFKEGKGDLVDKSITMIGVMLKLQEQDPKYWPDEIISAVLLNLLADAIEICSSTLVWALSLLVNNPSVLQKAQAEIDNLVGSDRLVEESDLISLPYLDHVFKETIRLYPPVPILVPHESSEDCVVEGYNIPSGTMLIVNQWAIHRDPKLWTDPESFVPERFDGSESTIPKYKYMPFGTGVRGCPADKLAYPAIGLGLALLIQCFDWERISEDLVDMTEAGGLIMTKAEPLVAKCTPRPIQQELVSRKG